MNLFVEEKQTHSQTLKTNTWLPKGTGVGAGELLGVWDRHCAHCDTWNDWPMGPAV